MAGVALVVFLFLLAWGVPIFAAIAVAGIIIILAGQQLPLATVAHVWVSGINKWVLLAVPLYIIAGNLMGLGGLSKYLFDFVNRWMGKLPAGMAISVVGSAAMFGAMTGVSTGTTAAIGSISLEPMTAHGYSKKFSANLFAAVGPLGNLIPPSVVLIIYGSLVEASVGKLFMGTLLPGIITSAMLMLTAALIARKTEPGIKSQPFNWTEARKSFFKAIPALFTIVVILGGIYGGIFTPTEAGAVACVYALLVGKFVYRHIGWSKFQELMRSSVIASGMIYMIMGAAFLFAIGLNFAGTPTLIANWVKSANLSPLMFNLVVTLVIVIAGCFLDPTPMIFIFVPLLYTSASALHIDPIYWGVVLQMALIIGTVTPPYGMCLFVSSAVTKVPVGDLYRGIWPYVIALVTANVLLILVPSLSLWLPSKMG